MDSLKESMLNEMMNDMLNETKSDIDNSSNDDINNDVAPAPILEPVDSKKPKAEKKTTNKKGPGRPRKAPCREVLPRRGISVKPTNPETCIEFLHDDPNMFKKIITFFKSTATHNIQIIFRPTEVVMFAKDHHDKSKIRIRIDATKVNHYYCKNTLDIGIALKDLDQLFNKADKDYKAFVLYSNSSGMQKNIVLTFVNEMEIDEVHTIDLIGQYNHIDNEREFIDEDYMIKFEWPNKYFRKTINDIRTISSQLSITQEDKNQPLILEYTSENKKIHSKYNVKNPAKIKLKSGLRHGDTFRVDIRLDYVKPISSSHIADNIVILLDENKKLMTKAYIDKDLAIEIKTITEIIDIRPE